MCMNQRYRGRRYRRSDVGTMYTETGATEATI